MSYSRKSLQLVGGGFNLLPPVDKVPITDLLLAQNFRSDSLGRLVSRPGYPSQFSIPGAGIAHSAASTGGPSAPYYVGCNSGIANPTSKLYYNGNPTPIATGFDGNRIGFASQNGEMWVMNRGNQGRHDPISGWFPFGLTPPPASLTVAPGVSPSTGTDTTFSYGFIGTTMATGNIAPGVQTIMPVSMAGIVAGINLSVSNAVPNSSNYEVVVVTSVTGSTFTATFTTAKAGPNILIGFPDYVHFLTIGQNTYSFPQNGYIDWQIPLVMAGLAGADPNCSVTYAGTGNDLVITAVVPFTLFPVSGSDSNAPADLSNGTVASLPNGTYQFYATFLSADLTVESNPSPVSLAVTVTGLPIAVTIPAADAPVDPRIGSVNIYATGGTLGSAYLMGNVPSTVASPATTFLDSIPDLQATNNGVVMPINHGPPPAASGIIGPFFGQLLAWSSVAHPNRLWYTQPDLPQYWNQDPQVGDWADVGLPDEAIVWCSIHQNITVIYKERSIWLLIGSVLTGQLEQIYDGAGLCGQFALAPAGQIDYFVSANGLNLFDMSEVHVLNGNIQPLFNQSVVNAGPLTPPGNVLPGSAFNSNSTACYAIALGHAMGRLYIAYAENGTGAFNLLTFDEGPEPERNAYLQARPGRWFYQRHAIPATLGFFGFFFDGISMVGLTGAVAGAAQGYSLADFRGFQASDQGDVAIECVYKSHYEDCGLPENDKVFLEVVIDCETGGTGGTVYVGFDNGNVALAEIGSVASATRKSFSFALPDTEAPEPGDTQAGGTLARNISIALDIETTSPVVIYNVYVYYYEEARLAIVAATLPTDLGVGKVKQCKELQLDIDASGGSVSVQIQSDLPGNALAPRQTPEVAQGGRAIFKYPFAVTEGFLWKLILYGPGYFRLYAVRLLMRVIGVFVESYESAAGFVWDSMQQDLGDADDKTFDQLRFDMDSDGAVSVTMLTDLPGEAFASRGTFVLTKAATQRAWVTVPLPPYGAANAAPIEGRSVQLQCIGPAGYRLYKAQARWSRVGRYLCATTPSGQNDAFNGLEFDYQSERRKMFKRIEIDLRADGVVTMQVITDQDGDKLAPVYAPNLQTPNGRTTLLVALVPGVRGRLMRLLLSGTAPARIYKIRVLTRDIALAETQWEWKDVPLEASDVLPKYADLIVDETPPQWQWVDVDFTVSDG